MKKVAWQEQIEQSVARRLRREVLRFLRSDPRRTLRLLWLALRYRRQLTTILRTARWLREAAADPAVQSNARTVATDLADARQRLRAVGVSKLLGDPDMQAVLQRTGDHLAELNDAAANRRRPRRRLRRFGLVVGAAALLGGAYAALSRDSRL
jgi:hypothetical protein